MLLNLFPYNSGHLLVCPYRHVAHVRRGDRRGGRRDRRAHPDGDARADRDVSRCDGFNIGMNQGAVAGAGIAAHLHQHVVPRWATDANFFPIIARPRRCRSCSARCGDELADGLARVADTVQ